MITVDIASYVGGRINIWIMSLIVMLPGVFNVEMSINYIRSIDIGFIKARK